MKWIDIRCLLAGICPCQVFWCFDRWWRCFSNTWMLEPKPLYGIIFGMVCVVWTALQRMLWMGSCHLLFCSALGCQWLQILPRTWVMSVFLPTSAPSPELVTESEVVTALRISLLEKRDALSGTKSWVPALSTGFSLPWFACSCCLLDISYPSYSVDNGSRCRDFPRYVIFEAALTTWQFLYAIFFYLARSNRAMLFVNCCP